ncbi:MAG TPA: geranylgeranylglycerol-phosphate geranylgeranyltransferase [Candidatus Thermoplasmatota archaeon]|nr:geranylgeranylglycerol-phosphate geranylgeranyltransferase [Candidatus Thermoplasmatota archaeon]
MGGFLALLRPGNGVVASAAVLAGALAGAGPPAVEGTTLVRVALGCAAAFCFIGAGNALNDFFDREIDKKAHPDRPIPSGRVTPRAALWVSAGLFATALAIGAFLSLDALAVVATSALMMLAYEKGLKAAGLPGNGAIAYLSGITFLFGGVVVAAPLSALPLALLGFLASLGREVAKDIEDMEADTDRRTLPQRVGAPRAGLVSAASTLAAVALSPLPFLPLGQFGLEYLAVIAAADATFIYAASVLRASPRGSQRLSKVGMALATLAFAVGGWFG